MHSRELNWGEATSLQSMATDPPLVTCDSTGTMLPAATCTCSTHQQLLLCSFFAKLIVPEKQVSKSTKKYGLTGWGESLTSAL